MSWLLKQKPSVCVVDDADDDVDDEDDVVKVRITWKLVAEKEGAQIWIVNGIEQIPKA